jgi:hypothetical protein
VTGRRDHTEIVGVLGAASPAHQEQFAAEPTQVRVAKMRPSHQLEILSDSIRSQSSLDHDEFGSNRSISISMFRKLDIDVINVIDIVMLELDRKTSLRNLRESDCAGKPALHSTFPHPALDRREGRVTARLRHFDHAGL